MGVFLLAKLESRFSTSPQLVNILLDTGANINSVNISTYDSLFDGDRKFINTSRKMDIRVANGAHDATIGTVNLRLTPVHPVTHKKYPVHFTQPFQVSQCLPLEALMGTSVLHNTVIDLKKMTLSVPTIPREHIPLSFEKFSKLYTDVQQAKIQSNFNNEPPALVSKRMDEQLKERSLQDILAAVKINNNLPTNQRSRLDAVLNKNRFCLDTPKELVSLFKFGNHKPLSLRLSSKVYERKRPYPMPAHVIPFFDKQIQTWLDHGVIAPQTEDVEFDHPILAVPKSDNTYRFCIDSGEINKILINETIVLPKISEEIGKACNKSFYTILDVQSFFLNFRLDEASSNMLTFTHPTTRRRFKFKRTPFGVKKSMENSVRLFETELERLPNRHNWLISYIDDLVLYHDNFEDHIRDLDRLLNLLCEINMHVKPSKAYFCMDHADVFGWRLDKDGRTISPKRYQALLSLAKPKNRRDLLEILGKASYFRTALPFDRPMAYFNNAFKDLVSAKKPFKWEDSHEQAWNEFKSALKRKLVLQRILDSDNSLIVRSDSSTGHFAGVLSTVRNGTEVVLSTYSKTWSDPARRYSIPRLECLACLLVLNEFKNDLYGKEVIVQTDNPYCFFIMSNPHKIEVEGTLFPRLFHGIRFLDYKMEKIKSSEPHWALVDRLSREHDRYIIRARNALDILEPAEELKTENLTLLADSKELRAKIDGNWILTPLLNLRKMEGIRSKIEQSSFFKQYGQVPKELRNELLLAIHNIGHQGAVRIASFLNTEGLRWPGRNDEIGRIVRECPTCGPFLSYNRKLNIRQADFNITQPGKLVAIDLTHVGQPSQLNILITVDLVTGFVTATRINGVYNAINIMKTLIKIIARYYPDLRVIRCDNGKYFKKEFQEYLQALGIDCSFVSRSNSRGNGRCERAVRSICDQLRLMKLKSFNIADVDMALEIAALIVNAKPLHGNISPFMLMFGKTPFSEPRSFPDLNLQDISEYQRSLLERIRDLHSILRLHFLSPTHEVKTKLLKIGDLVRLKVPQERGRTKITSPLFSETIFRIIDVNPERLTYKLVNTINEKDQRFSHDRYIKPYLLAEEIPTEVKAAAPLKITPTSNPSPRFTSQPIHKMKLRRHAKPDFQ